MVIPITFGIYIHSVDLSWYDSNWYVHMVYILAACANYLFWYLYFDIKPIDDQIYSHLILALNKLVFLPTF